MAKFFDPTSVQLNKTLARRFIPLVDQLRDLLSKFGLRPYKVRIVRAKWSGGERGVGTLSEISELVLLPTPRIHDLISLTEIVQPVGLDEIGAVMLDEISGRFTEDELMGRDSDGSQIPLDEEMFYEVEFPRPDGKAGPRRRFFPRSAPHYAAGKLQWMVHLEKVHEDRARVGDPE